MTKMIDIKAFIDDRPIAPFLWVLVAMCFLVVVADGMDVAIMGFVTPPILQDWNISRPAFGFVISAAPFGLVIGALIAGPSPETDLSTGPQHRSSFHPSRCAQTNENSSRRPQRDAFRHIAGGCQMPEGMSSFLARATIRVFRE